MEKLDKNKSYFFLFESCDYTLDQVRSFSLEECCENCFHNDPYDEKYDLNGDGVINSSDVTCAYDVLLGSTQPE